MISRRDLLGGAIAGGVGLWLGRWGDEARFSEAVRKLERENGGRLGAAMIDTGNGMTVAYRGTERFPMCSTAKLLAAGYVLARVDQGKERLDRRVVYRRSDLVPYSPTTGSRVGEPGLTVGELLEAALTLSDNTAMNLLLDSFGGPAALTSFLRESGDRLTRLDRKEPELNEAIPGDPRDTTTPLAMACGLRDLALGDDLSEESRKRLCSWMVECKTGDTRLRAGLPKGWRVGDKTGTGKHGATNDVAIVWPPNRAPLIVAVYYTGSTAPPAKRDAVLAEVGRIVPRLWAVRSGTWL